MANELWKVAQHLLANGWETKLDPSMGKPCDAAIAEEIIKKYPKFAKSNIERWRYQHKKCNYCIYKMDYPMEVGDDEYVYCTAKRKHRKRNATTFCSLFCSEEE